MKKIVYIITILSLITGACSKESPAPRTKDETFSQMQQSIKAIASLSSESENKTTVIYNKFTTQFTQKTNSQTNTADQFNLRVKAASNNMHYPVKSYKADLKNGVLQADPKPDYITYQARHADTKYIESTIADIFNLKHLLQDVIKPEADHMTVNKDSMHYEGHGAVMTALFEYGLASSSLNQVESLADIQDLKVKSGSYTVDYSPVNVYPKTLTFDVEMTGTIDEEPVHIHMKQTTNYYDFNKTKVKDLIK
ncbi:hypothetical protein [Macrococcus equipercicus]|uniref:Lipoprotein n=1 Tax=Macrococcus equipercicus TaxID=69967 RepID=A0A9Q9BUN8_9STAP|nr:hypothetical protein [Macrococcus equipercicus]KAA1039091.1 hypothetical protein ERX35_007705 [Macrococcus equipercicus]UTH13268.1 hypothetical protein KFV11_08335 [Macrococcus equipercicus]